ncbi:hypothetical protein CC80DRAFT_495624 [Byssothecium circinans]|uniref:Uncharacterized protein n=1 Tax=Byssothecium circinans TaxID=147558 RepID=A0A6A5TH97_9PLEO|nr:hypothetical protein CC80DRAFT_495624 [Byssothecium circinans]
MSSSHVAVAPPAHEHPTLPTRPPTSCSRAPHLILLLTSTPHLTDASSSPAPHSTPTLSIPRCRHTHTQGAWNSGWFVLGTHMVKSRTLLVKRRNACKL